MNDTTLSPATANNGLPNDTAMIEKSSCCQRMIAACKDMCTRFLDSRISVSYNITTQLRRASERGTEKNGKQASGGTSPCTMAKQGTMELRPLDLAASAMLICVLSSVCVAIKCMCKCK